MTTIFDIELNESDFLHENYNFQPELTQTLDEIDSDFNQSIINQIVLWKVNRYSSIDEKTLSLLNKIKKDNFALDINLTKEILERLLLRKGIQLAMASTILRFKNPKIYQIIDQRVYRFLYGENLPVYFSTIEKQIKIYLNYLEKLKIVCEEKNINYELSDRIIYELDKFHNKDLKIKY